jgi:hypothetical protein
MHHKIKRIKHLTIITIAILFITGFLLELCLKFVTVKKGHISYLFGKPWYYLIPFEVPKEFPSIEKKEGSYRVYDPLIGWSLGTLGKDEPLYYSNRFAIRCSIEDYLRHKAANNIEILPEMYDVICIGNSFTHGDEVKCEETWASYLADMRSLQVLNLGVGGYGIDQAGLRFKYFNVKCKVLILGLIAGDLERATTQIYNLTNGGLKTKPIFEFSQQITKILNQPAIHGSRLCNEFALGAKSSFFQHESSPFPEIFASGFLYNFYIYRVVQSYLLRRIGSPPIYRTEGPKLDFCFKILKYIQSIALESGAEFYILILDNLNTFGDRKFEKDPWNLFLKRCEKEHIKYIYHGDIIYNQYMHNPDRIINKGQVHYTPYAHHEVARLISETNILSFNKRKISSKP